MGAIGSPYTTFSGQVLSCVAGVADPDRYRLDDPDPLILNLQVPGTGQVPTRIGAQISKPK